MRLRKIELENYRNHAHSVIDLGDAAFVVFRGPNHAGKSSIREAISMAFALTTPSLDPQGRQFTRKIKRGEEKSVIKIDVQGKHLIQQMVVLNTNTSGRTSRSTCLDDPDWKPLPFDNFLTRYKDAFLVTLNTDYFMQKMDENKQKALLAKLALPDHYDFPQEKIDAVLRVLGDGSIDFSGEPFAVIEKAYKKLYEERSVVNRQVKDFVIPEALPMVAGVDSKALQDQLDAARSEQRQINAEKDAAVKAAGDVEVKRAKLQTKIESLREECRKLKEKATAQEKDMLPPEGVETLRHVAAKADTLAKLQSERANHVTVREECKKALARFEEIPEAGTKCPTCDQVIDGKQIEALKKEISSNEESARQNIEAVDAKIAALGEVNAAVETLAAHDKAAKEKENAEKELAEKVKEEKTKVEELNALPASVDAGEAFAEKLREAEAKITSLTEQLRPVIAAEERKQEIKTRKEMLANLEKKAAEVNALVEYFDKDGIKAQLLAEHVGGFVNRLNETLDAWGYKCNLSIEPYEFQVTNAAGDTSLITELSDSEQLMFSVALQQAVARAAGIGFIVADRMETLDPEERTKANRCLYHAVKEENLEQVIIVLTDASTEVPKLADSAFFFVKGGTVTRL